MKKIFAGLTALAIAGAMAGAVPFAAGSLFDTSVKASAEETKQESLERFLSSGFANFDPDYIKSIIQDILLENNPDLSEFKMTIDGKVATVSVLPTSDNSGDFVYTAGTKTITVPVSIETDAETGEPRVIADGVRVTGNTPEGVLFVGQSWGKLCIVPDPDNMPEPKPTTGNTDVLYGVDPAYTVTIPASVDVTGGDQVTSIGFSDVVLENGQSIIVKLTDTANEHTPNATDFKLMSADNSPVIYNIKKGTENVKLGGEAAKFTYNGTTSEGAQELTITRPLSVVFAGSYKDTLTFTISVENKPTELSATVDGVTFTYHEGDNWGTIAENNANIENRNGYIFSGGYTLFKNGRYVKSEHEFDPNATDYSWEAD